MRALRAALLLVVLAASLWGESQLIKVDVDLVNVYLTVCNKSGRLITNLARENFTVLEDGAPQVITNFSKETDVPLTIALVIDTSGSVRDKLPFEKEAATRFLYALLHGAGDKAAVFTFDSLIELRQDYTNDPALLARAVFNMHAGGGTRLYDGLLKPLHGKFAEGEERKVIVLLTDGNDNSSRSAPQDVVEAAQRNSVTIYAISMNALGMHLEDSNRYDALLDSFASETGGEAFFPNKVGDLSAQFKRIISELRSQYTIAYRSTNPKKDGAFRRIQIGVTNRRYSVRARSGYYAAQEATASR